MRLWPRRKTFTSKPRYTFSGPMPIDQMFYNMLHSTGKVTRDQALSVPAVQRGRNLICSISTLPLVQLNPKRMRVRNPLLEQLDPDVPNVVTLAQTLEDLLFESIAWWKITASDFDDFPVAVRHLDVNSVSLNPPSGRNPLPSGNDPRGVPVVYIDGVETPASMVIRFDSPNPAVLRAGGRAIRRAIALDMTSELYTDNPRPLDYFTPDPNAEEPNDNEVQTILNDWLAARKKGSTAYVPRALNYNPVDSPSPADLQLIESQKKVSLDLANALCIDPEELGISTTSRTYNNAVDRRRDRINDVLSLYMRAITDRLSMGDVTRHGHKVVFDLDDYLKANPTERASVQKTYLDMGVITVDEIREEEGLPVMAEAPSITASDPAAHTFDAPALQFVDVPVREFSVDRESRTISGVVMPYGDVGNKYGMKFRFAKGSLEWADPTRVKLNTHHDIVDTVGYAEQLKPSGSDLFARFKVAPGPKGDQALSDAENHVLDGFSVGVDFDMAADTVPDPKDRTVTLVRRADLRHVALTPEPTFTNARVTKVAAGREGRNAMECIHCGQVHAEGQAACQPNPEPPAVDPTPVTFTADQVAAMFNRLGIVPTPETEPEPQRQVVDPTRRPAVVTREALPYRFDRGGNFIPTEHIFSADVHEMARCRDGYGTETDAGKRVMGLLRARFDVASDDINETTPNIQRPDMYVDQQDYKYPIWNAINKGAPPNGIQPFTFPKFSSATVAAADHTEGTEPTGGTLVTTSQTVTPTALSGKAYLTREVWDMGGNPAVSTLIFNQMVRSYKEGLESAAATFLNTLTAATDITLTTAAVDDALASDWDAAVADLQFVRGYDFEVFVLEKVLYKTFVDARDSTGRPLYAQIAPANANGTAARRFMTLDLAGVIGIPSWALASTAGSANNSWLFDPMFVHGWATAPLRLDFPGGSDDNTTYEPVAKVGIGIWGYKALANSDIGAVRQVIYDSTT